MNYDDFYVTWTRIELIGRLEGKNDYSRCRKTEQMYLIVVF